MENRYDVIIVGAGPGGLACADQLNNSHLSVLLLEKNRVVGPKPCAGGLTHPLSSFSIPEEGTRSFPIQRVFLSDREYRIPLENPLRTISRLDLGQHQLRRLKDSRNIHLLTETPVKAVTENEVETDRGVFHYRHLVGADGSNSIVRKYLKLPSEYGFGLYYEMPEITGECTWYADPRVLRSGYIWVFPHRDHTNIGIYFNPRHIRPRQAKDILRGYALHNTGQFTENALKGSAINYSFQGNIFQNVYLVGDAAGLAPKPTGEGISSALISGREIAKKILDPRYPLVELNRLLRHKKRQERLLKALELFPAGQTNIIRLILTLVRRGWFQTYLGI